MNYILRAFLTPIVYFTESRALSQVSAPAKQLNEKVCDVAKKIKKETSKTPSSLCEGIKQGFHKGVIASAAIGAAATAGTLALEVTDALTPSKVSSALHFSTALSILAPISIVGLLVPILASIYRTYQDLSAPDDLVSQKAKIYSLLRLAGNVVLGGVLIAALCTPIFNLITFAALLALYSGIGLLGALASRHGNTEYLQEMAKKEIPTDVITS